MMESYQFPAVETGYTTPPDFSPRTMAEWEKLDGIMITWTSFTNILSQIVDYAQEEGMVYIVCSDSNSVKNYLNSQSIPLYNIEYLEESYNSIWCRDYGPWTIYKDYTEQLSYVDWVYNRPRPSDDLIPEKLADYLGLDYYSTSVSPYRLVNTGGNFMTDGHGTGFASKLVLNENSALSETQIDNIVDEFMGIEKYIKMNTLPYDGIHHIDMHMKLLDEETLLVGQYPPGVADGPQIEANLEYVLSNFKTCFDRDFKVVRIPMPPDAQGRYPNQGGDYRTYTNSLIVNGTVIIPTYEEQYDTTAFRIYREAMPGYKIVGINSNSIIPSLGTIHCITKELGSDDPVFISHAKVREGAYNSATEIKTFVNTPSGVSDVKLFWSTDTLTGYNEVSMTMAVDTFYASIPPQDYGTDVFYYIEAESNSGSKMRKPPVAPRGVYKFSIGEEQFSSNIEMNTGWNLASVPVVLENMNANVVFGNAASAIFGYDLTYTMVEEVEPGRAYWVKYDTPENIPVTGIRPNGHIALGLDWNMIGPFNRDMAVEEIYTEPENIITTQFYFFDGGYFAADTLKQGKGYWVKTNAEGMLIVDVPVAKKGNANSNELKGSLTITDASGKSRSLYMIDDNNVSYYEMPPKAPGKIFDVRFDDNTMAINADEFKNILVENATYPLSISSEISGISINGNRISDEGIVIQSERILAVSFNAAPQSFSLDQNYPNPFNPSTKVAFTVPVQSRVSLEVYNTLGEKVFEYVNNEIAAGSQEVEFRASGLSSGIYFYSLKAHGLDGSEFNATRKMMLIK
ncbi:MAG: hypothetical protein SCALA702_06040 [Melioribacteraceae bacterium]|nr:MAG: hypothetical protein SCALA702_06040 [Melioribacteraceae bacterium]